MNNSPQYVLSIGYKEKYVEETINAKFHGLQIDYKLHQKNHIDQIGCPISSAMNQISLFQIFFLFNKACKNFWR